MTEQTKKRVRYWLGLVTSISIAAAAVFLMIGCTELYRQGPFTPEAVAAAFSRIRIPVFICLSLVAAGFLAALFLPEPESKPTRSKNNALTLQRPTQKADLAADEAIAAQIRRERNRRKTRCLIRTTTAVTAAVIFLAYALDGSHFHTSQINESMAGAMPLLLGCLTISFGAAIYTAYRNAASVEREIHLLKQLPTAKAAPPQQKKNSKRSPVPAAILICAAVALLLYGYFTGGTNDVLTKAVNICTECVGLG